MENLTDYYMYKEASVGKAIWEGIKAAPKVIAKSFKKAPASLKGLKETGKETVKHLKAGKGVTSGQAKMIGTAAKSLAPAAGVATAVPASAYLAGKMS